ncbi:amino acid ABC transporter permease [Rhodococcus sp. NPDC079359]|uniref:amino acid ABC transporter permease n=1 Tax=Rhodococcus sp. NPDC079359 TaxID=3154961 RepID=UPI00344D66F3
MVIERRSYLPWILAAVAAALTVGFGWLLISNPALDWTQTVQYLFAPQVLKGVWVTIQLSILSMAVGICVGIFIGLGRMSDNGVLRTLSTIYVTIFRGIPVLLQLLIWGNIGLIVRNVTVGVPFTDVAFFSVPTNELIGPFTAAIIGLALAEAAYIAEVVRAGVLSVDRGQLEAASALGMTPGRTTRRIMLPQALRLIIPPMGNQFVTLIKATSLVSVIAGGDLLTQVQNISATSYRIIEMLAVAAFWYLVLVSVATIAQHFLERAVSKGIKA